MAKEQDQNIINIDMGSMEPVYSNNANISHGPFDFTMNFVQVSPPSGKLVAKVIMSPQHAKAFLTALQENIARFEKSFGQIKQAQGVQIPGGPEIGYKH